MNNLRKIFTPGELDPRINSTILTPKNTIINTLLLLVYSGLLLSIYDNIDFIPENSKELAASILGLIIVASVCMATLSSYTHYIKYTRPILYLAHAAKAVSMGDYTIQLPIENKDGKTNEIDALYEDFNDMVNELNSTEMLRNSFISNISHELKTPIAVISNYSTLLADENLSEAEKKEYVNKIRTTSAELSTLISNILQISKLDNDQIKPSIEKFNLSENLIQCILGFEITLDEKDIELELDIPENIYVASDPGLLKIAFNNIISNALKFTPDKGTLAITLTEQNNIVQLSFRDTGCGIDEKSLKHIFDKFYQADTSHATMGNGLGLAMVRKIILLLKGDIYVTSTPGVGSTFTISLINFQS